MYKDDFSVLRLVIYGDLLFRWGNRFNKVR